MLAKVMPLQGGRSRQERKASGGCGAGGAGEGVVCRAGCAASTTAPAAVELQRPPPRRPHHLNVGAQKWIVLGPAGWFQNADSRDAAAIVAGERGAAALRRGRHPAGRNAPATGV